MKKILHLHYVSVLLILLTTLIHAETTWTTGTYDNNQNLKQTLTVPNAKKLIVTLKGETEAWKDIVWFTNKNGNMIPITRKESGKTNKWLSGVIEETFTVEGSSITANFKSNASTTKLGITVTVRDAGTNNIAPTVSNVTMAGTAKIGETLTLNYDFHDEDGDSEGASIIAWSTPTIELQRGTSKTFTIPAAYRDEEIGAWVHPLDEYGIKGKAYGAINNNLIILGNDSKDSKLTWTTGVYKNNQELSKILSLPGATRLSVTVTGETEIWEDIVWFKDENEKIIPVTLKSGRTGKWLSGVLEETFTVAGSSITTNFKSNASTTKSGVTVTISNTYKKPVFPNAKGFGTDTRAAYGGKEPPKVYKVTNLNDSGSGSLREALEAREPRVIVFEVSGTIDLNSAILISKPYITLAGQTAPSPGITIKGYHLAIKTHDVLIQHIRVRAGDENLRRGKDKDPNNNDCISIQDPSENVVIDHCSVSWSIDENIELWSTNNNNEIKNITISNTISSESLHNKEGYFDIYRKNKNSHKEHSKGLIIGPRSKKVSIINNLFSHNDDRNPYINYDASDIVIANNFLYAVRNNVRTNAINITRDVDKNGRRSGINYNLRASIVGNVLKLSNKYDAHKDVLVNISKNVNRGKHAIYIEGNIGKIINNAGQSVLTSKPPVWIDGYKVISSDKLEKYILNNVGARPKDRDNVDKRIIRDIKNLSGTVLRSQDDVGGWPSLSKNSHTFDIPTKPHNDDDLDGYSNLEEALHEYLFDLK